MAGSEGNHHHKKWKTLLEIKRLLEEKPRTKKELAQLFGADPKTIKRAFDDLTDLGFPVLPRKQSLGPEFEYHIEVQEEKLQPIPALLTHTAVRLVLHHSPGFNEHYMRALKSLVRQIPAPAQHMADQSTRVLEQRKEQKTLVGDRFVDLGSNLEKVAQAWFNTQRITFEYLPPEGDGTWRKQVLDVYFIEISRSNLGLYVIGKEHGFHQGIRTFKLNRMNHITPTGEIYTIPDDFNPSAHLSNAWGVMGTGSGQKVKVVLKFAPEAAYRLLEEHNPLLMVHPRAKDTDPLTVELEVGVDRTGFPREVFPWIQSWGPRVEVVSPRNLRDRWIREARKVLEKHSVYKVVRDITRTNPLSECAMALWAKSDRDQDEKGAWHPVIAHLLDVAACAEAILEREPESTRTLYARDFGFEQYRQVKPWLLSLIALHDLGKASPTFQSMWSQGVARVNATGLGWDQKPAYAPHGFVSQKALEDLLQEAGWDPLVAPLAADAVGCHHGLRATLAELDSKVQYHEMGGPAWEAVRKELFDAVLHLFKAEPQNTPTLDDLSGGAFYRLAGLTSFADWLGSNSDLFPFQTDIPDLEAYYFQSLERARDALDQIGWGDRDPLMPEERTFSEVFPFEPRPLQEVVSSMVQVDAPTLLLVEAPMGEGKTEAAFYAHLKLQQRLGHRGMYVALPTQATGNMMFTRTLEFLQSLKFHRDLDLQLLHGATALNDHYQKIRKIQVLDGQDNSGSVHAAEWFSHKKRALLSEYGVGTVDQALLSVLNIKHQFVRMWGLSNRTVIIDEVHAYDTYTSTLIEKLVSWLHALGSSVVLMSATLPAASRARLLKAYGAKNANLPAPPYPRVYRVSDGQVTGQTFEADPKRKTTLQVRGTRAETENVAALLSSLVAEGGCVAYIANTVQRAQDTFKRLQQQHPEEELFIFHARYPALARKELEDLVVSRFGKKGERPRKAILIATQVVEQSLDLDFDVMVTDLAPIDLVLQRAGRLQRHKELSRERHNHQTPVLYVAGLDSETEIPNLKKPLFWDRVYEPYILLKTFLSLKNHQEIQLPEDIDALIEEVYAETFKAPSLEFRDALQEAQDRLKANQKKLESLARNAVLGSPEDGSWQNIDGLEKLDPEDRPEVHPDLQARTRLIDANLTVVPLEWREGRVYLQNTLIPTSGEMPFWMVKELSLNAVALSRWDILNTYWKTPQNLPEVTRKLMDQWQQVPLLRNLVPLVLEAGEATFGKIRVSYRPEQRTGMEYIKDSEEV